ncbi:hypothetical protein [Candidatus Methylacidithermus pantelleriae]|uniref:hypothetical protein n=1 Tax=Candidatus Methylacidithermus pantelleriae TaxID=2744239 RepID=UPI00157C0096|nr:hypothetical protein [Candidatus Methylacidithermus pantelleriae]
MGLSQDPSVGETVLAIRDDGLATFALPASNPTKHVWWFWAGVQARLKGAQAAHARFGGDWLPPTTLSGKTRRLGATWALLVKPVHANCRQHGSVGVRNRPSFVGQWLSMVFRNGWEKHDGGVSSGESID